MSGGFPLRCRSKSAISGHATWQSLMSTPILKMISTASLGSQRWDSARCLSISKMGCSGGSSEPRILGKSRYGAHGQYGKGSQIRSRARTSLHSPQLYSTLIDFCLTDASADESSGLGGTQDSGREDCVGHVRKVIATQVHKTTSRPPPSHATPVCQQLGNLKSRQGCFNTISGIRKALWDRTTPKSSLHKSSLQNDRYEQTVPAPDPAKQSPMRREREWSG